ncbi:MAG TPA: hypothetical protein VEW03_01780, partial [Longimicrobiaceae bacterium]|nr:hypothetical protein [Longimicrobiaceae bacterium]
MAQAKVPVAAISARVPSRLRRLHSEIARRRLYATATAYSVGAAGFIQLMDVLAPRLGLPPTTVNLVLYVGVAGLPVVLALAWVFDLNWEKDGEAAAVEVPPAAAVVPPGIPLPGDPTEFVGRAVELAEARRLLAAPGCRLLTVTGPGGIGKTRLALRAAAAEAERFRDGARFAGLASLERPELLASELAAALGVEGAGGEQPQARLLEFLRGKELLLVVDGVEDVAAAAGGLLATLLERVPGLTVVATSRERLGLAAETVFPLEGLSLPRVGDAEELERSDAARLFLAGARRARPGWEPSPEDPPHLARVCRLTEGSPLALELASAWVRLLSCAEIAAEIARDRDFLSAASGAFPERHRSLRSVFDGSWRLLPEPERQVLRRVSVFQGGFTREAALAVAGAGLPLLASLHARSLVRRTPGGRFDVAEALRGYAEEKLRLDPAELEATEGLHRACYAGLLHSLAAARGHDGAELRAVADDLDNVRRAWDSMVEARAAGELERAREGLYLFYAARGRAREGEAAFAAAEGALAADEAHAGVLAS